MKKLIITILSLITLNSFSQINVNKDSLKLIGVSRYSYKFYSIDLKLNIKSDYKVYITSPLDDTTKIITLSDFNGLYGYILDLTFKPNGIYEVILTNKQDSVIERKKFIIN